MPNRIIRESIRTSRTLAKLSAEAERMFIRLITVADDYGRFDADPRVLKATCFPLLVDAIETQSIEKWRDELKTAELIGMYEIEGRIYGYFTKWGTFQRQYGTKSKFPDPPAKFRDSPQLAADSRSSPRIDKSIIEKREARIEGEIKEREGVGSKDDKLRKANEALLKRRAQLNQ